LNAEERILRIVGERREEGILQSEIAKTLGLSKSTVSEVLQRLEREGRIVRERVAGKSMRVWLAEFSPKPIEGRVRVGVLRASEYPHVLLACDEVDAIVKVFDSAIELTKALSFGYIDLGVSPFVTQTMFALTLRSIRIHCIVAYNGSGVVMKKELGRCRSFGTSELSAMESNLKLFLERLGLDINRLTFKYFSSPESMVKLFKACEFDAVAIWEPYFTSLKGKYDWIEFREVIGDFPCCSLASNVRFYEERRDVVRNFVEGLRSYTEFDERRGARIVSEVMGFEEETVARSFESYRFSAELKQESFRFLERYGLKLTEETIKKISTL